MSHRNYEVNRDFIAFDGSGGLWVKVPSGPLRWKTNIGLNVQVGYSTESSFDERSWEKESDLRCSADQN